MNCGVFSRPCLSWIRLRSVWPTVLRFFSKACWQVSSQGRICNRKGAISYGYLHPSGYRIMGISGQKWPVHRVVKITFHGLAKSEETWQVHHVDGDRANNSLDNLEYVSQSENVRHSFSNSFRRSSGPAQSKPVLWRPVGTTAWTTCSSVTAAAQQLGVHHSTVSRCSYTNSVAKGYEFRYQDSCQHALTGEEWRHMVDPMSGVSVPERMVSSLGRVKSLRGVVSRGHRTAAGYYTMGFTINAHCHRALVHRLVAFAFLGPPPSDHQRYVNHKDLNKGNNAADNLEWVSAAENLAHFRASSIVGRGTTAKPVWSRLRGTSDGWRWHYSLRSAASELGLCRHKISKSACGIQQHTDGYEFQLSDTLEIVSVLAGEEWCTVDELLLQRDREMRGFCGSVESF